MIIRLCHSTSHQSHSHQTTACILKLLYDISIISSEQLTAYKNHRKYIIAINNREGLPYTNNAYYLIFLKKKLGP